MTPSNFGDFVDGGTVSPSRVIFTDVEFAFFLGVGDELSQVLEEVTISRRDAARGDYEEALFVVIASVGGDGLGCCGDGGGGFVFFGGDGIFG
jgi:hypothetical protein